MGNLMLGDPTVPTAASLTREAIDRIIAEHFRQEADGDVAGTLKTSPTTSSTMWSATRRASCTAPARWRAATGTWSATSGVSAPTSNTVSTVRTMERPIADSVVSVRQGKVIAGVALRSETTPAPALGTASLVEPREYENARGDRDRPQFKGIFGAVAA